MVHTAQLGESGVCTAAETGCCKHTASGKLTQTDAVKRTKREPEPPKQDPNRQLSQAERLRKSSCCHGLRPQQDAKQAGWLEQQLALNMMCFQQALVQAALSTARLASSNAAFLLRRACASTPSPSSWCDKSCAQPCTARAAKPQLTRRSCFGSPQCRSKHVMGSGKSCRCDRTDPRPTGSCSSQAGLYSAHPAGIPH
jgi:hypothetical protein